MRQVFQLRCSPSFMGKQKWHIFLLGKARGGFDPYMLNPEQTHALWLRSEYSLDNNKSLFTEGVTFLFFFHLEN